MTTAIGLIAIVWISVAIGFFMGYLARTGESPVRHEFNPGPAEDERDLFQEAMEYPEDDDFEERIPTIR